MEHLKQQGRSSILIIFFVISAVLILTGCRSEKSYDLIIRNALVYDGSGKPPFKSDIAINADTIAFIGDLRNIKSKTEVDANGKAVAPGFINMLSWANESLIEDGRSQGDIRQGVTLEVFGEGWSMGPLNDRLKEELRKDQSVIKYPVEWSTFGGYLDWLEERGVSCNIASFVGATTIRQYVIGEDNRPPTPQELESMKLLVRQAMKEGALGVGSSLIYPPAFFASTDELIALSSEAAKAGGRYISHIRNEGNSLLEAIDEILRIAEGANIPVEIYHLKAAGKNNWKKIDSVIHKLENARQRGLEVTANMYLYTAGATGLTAAFPPSLQDGGFHMLWKRLQDPVIRASMKKEMQKDAKDWDNLYFSSGGPDKVLLLGFKQDSLNKYLGKTLKEVAAIRGRSAEETAMDLIVQDSSRIDVAYFLMSEENVKKQISLPWMSFGSDAGSYATEGNFLKFSTHPRAYGNFSRLLGHYVRDEKITTLEDAIRRLTSFPATNLKLEKRGSLKPGYYADVVIFDPEKIQDHATFARPHQYSTGMIHVFVNGVHVLNNGEHTNAKPGRFLKGPGFGK